MSLPSLDGDGKEKKIGLPNLDMPPIEEDFGTVPLNEVPEDNDKENDEIYEAVEQQKEEKDLPNIEESEKELSKTESDYNPDYNEKEDPDKFIDKKKVKLIPFGGKKSKKDKTKVVRSSDFDDRKNKLAKTKVIQFSILLVIVILFVVGLKNTFLPAHVYTENQIKQIAAQGSGKTAFPAERGRAYVESFMDSYLKIDRERADYMDVLGHFYGEERLTNSSFSKLNMNWGTHTKQHVILSPKVFEETMLTDYSAQYKVSAFVSSATGEEVSGNNSAGRWVSFAINVYHDKATDGMVITPDSPTVIPPYKITNQASVPPRVSLGNGVVNTEIEPALTPTVNGFIEAYAKSSLESHDSVVQYIYDKNNVELLNGFGGAVKLNGSPSSAIKKVVYEHEDGIYRLEVTVKWIDAIASTEDNKIEYTSKYIMRVNPVGEGKYLVSSFVPYTYYK